MKTLKDKIDSGEIQELNAGHVTVENSIAPPKNDEVDPVLLALPPGYHQTAIDARPVAAPSGNDKEKSDKQ